MEKGEPSSLPLSFMVWLEESTEQGGGSGGRGGKGKMVGGADNKKRIKDL